MTCSASASITGHYRGKFAASLGLMTSASTLMSRNIAIR